MKYLVLFVFTILLFINNDSLSLWEQDEAAYAGFAYNMVEHGDYLIPDFEWSWPHRKPPLHFWMIAASYKAFGYNEFATRLPSAISILVCVFLIYFFTKRLYSISIALWASAIFMGSLLMPLYGKIGLTDACLLTCFIGSYFSILSYLKHTEWKWLISLFFFVSGGALIKGPPIFITVCGALALGFIFGQNRKLFFSLFLASILGVIPFSIWAYSTWIQDGGKFFSWWIDWYILKRTSGTIYGQSGFIGYYLLVLIVCFLPWLLFIPNSLKKLGQDFFQKNKSNQLLVQSSWVLFGWLFYEFIPSKLPSYAFAVIPIWCIYIAQSIVAYKGNRLVLSKTITNIQAYVYVLLGLAIFIFKDKIPFENFQVTAIILASFFILSGVFYRLSSRLNFFNNLLPEWALCFAFGINFIAWGLAIPTFEMTRRFPKSVANKLISLDYNPKHVFFSCDYSMSSLPVYLAWSGYSFQTAARDHYEKCTEDSLQFSAHNLFLLQRRNFRSLSKLNDSFKLSTIYGWISDRGVVDTFFIAERVTKN